MALIRFYAPFIGKHLSSFTCVTFEYVCGNYPESSYLYHSLTV